MVREDDVIDISDLSGDKLREHLRRLSDLTSCPCNTCRAICDRFDTIDKCTAYQLWYEERIKVREASRNTGGGHARKRKSEI